MPDNAHDETLARIENDLRESRTQAWDVEKFLASRHQAKIDALTAREGSGMGRLWEVVKGLGAAVTFLVGYLAIAVIAFAWLLYGEFPLHSGLIDHDLRYHQAIENPIPPPAGLAPSHPDYEAWKSAGE